MDDPNDIVDLWKSQPLAESRIDMEMIVQRAEQFQRAIKRRNLTEYVACGALVAWAANASLRSESPPLVKLGVVLIALGGLAVVAVVHRRGGAAGEPPLAASTREVMAWHRRELVRQRNLLRGVPRWYLGPFLPGIVVALVGGWIAAPEQGLYVALVAAIVAVVFGSVAWLNARAASKLKEQIDELSRGLEG